MIRLKRVYESPSAEDGIRVLVERLWPRGLTKARADVDLWLKDIAPSPELRVWFGHDVRKWELFRRRYQAELERKSPLVNLLKTKAKTTTVTLVFAARDEAHNSAVVLKEFLSRREVGHQAVLASERPQRCGFVEG